MKIRWTVLMIAVMVVTAAAGCSGPAVQPVSTQTGSVPQVTTQVEPTQPVASQPTPPTPTANPNAQVVLDMVARLNAGDVDGSLAYFADDAVIYFIGLPPTGMETYRGKEALRPVWEYSAGDHMQWEVEITRVEGDLVQADASTWLDFTRSLGVAPNTFKDVYQVKDGKIVTYGSTITEEALAKFKPALYEVMPPEPTAVPSSDPAVSELVVTVDNDTCTTNNPAALKAGPVNVTFDVRDQDRSQYALTLFTLDEGEGKDILDLMAATVGLPPGWVDLLPMKELGPGESTSYTINLQKGPLILICWSQPPDLPIGNAGPIEVVPAAPTPTPPARAENEIMVTFTDKTCSYEGPAVIPTGSVNVIMNMQSLDVYQQANVLMFYTLEPGYDLQDLVEALWMPAPPDWSRMTFMHEAYPGEVTYNPLAVDAGPLYYLCLSGESEDSSKLVGKGGPLEVSP